MFKRFLLVAAFVLAGHVSLFGQAASGSVYVTAKVRLAGWTDTAAATATTLSLADQTLSALPASGKIDSEIETFTLETGRTYSLMAKGLSPYTTNTVKVVAPPGYIVMLGGKKRTAVNIAGQPITVRILPPDEATVAPAGSAGGFAVGSVKWAVSLGAYRGGVSSAGWLRLTGAGLSDDWTSFINAASLYYEDASSDVLLYSPKGVIRQISMPEAFVDVIAEVDANKIPTALTLNFYQPDSVKGSVWPRTFKGLPFVSYRIIKEETAVPLMRRLIVTREVREITSPTDTTAPVVYRDRSTIERTGTSPADYRWVATPWTIDRGTSLSRVVSKWSTVSGLDGHHEELTAETPAGDVATRVFNVYTKVASTLNGNTNLKSADCLTYTGTAEDFNNSPAATWARTSYYSDLGVRSSYGFAKSQNLVGGAWLSYAYKIVTDKKVDDDKLGTIAATYSPFVDAPATAPADTIPENAPITGGAVPSPGVYTTYDYAADAFKMLTRLKESRTYINGTLVAQVSTTYTSSSANGSTVVVASSLDQTGASGGSLATETKYYREDTPDDLYRSQPYSMTKPDGTMQSYVYERGDWTVGTGTFARGGTRRATRIGVISGASDTTPGATAMTTFDGYGVDKIWLVPNRSTIELAIRDQYNRLVRTESQVWDGSGWRLVSWVNFTSDWNNRLVKKVSSNGDVYEVHYSAGVKNYEIDGAGLKVTYTYDDIGRVKTTTKVGANGQPDLVIAFTYDAAGHVVRKETYAAGGNEKLVAISTYDFAGQVITEIAPGVGTTTYQYSPGTHEKSVTLPDGSTHIETTYLDGQLYSKTGSGVVPEYYTYAVDYIGQRITTIYSGAPDSPRHGQTIADWIGRPVQTLRPGFTGRPDFVEQNTYNPTTGLLLKTERGPAPFVSGASGNPASTLFEYDALGQPTCSGLDINGNGTLDRAGPDRISGQEKALAFEDNAWWAASRSYGYASDGSSVQTTTGSTRQRLSGFTGSLRAEARTTDAEGNTTKRTVTVDRAAHTTTTTTTLPGLANPQVETVVNGLATTATTPDGLTVSNGYDALQRPLNSTNPRTGTASTSYYPGTTQAREVKDARGVVVATYAYDSMGRTLWSRNADGKYTRTKYNVRGQVLAQWGDATYPVSYDYTPYGERFHLYTYQAENGWNADTWPENVTPTSTTTWEYDAPSGLLVRKTDDIGAYVQYDYTVRGQLNSRMWARTLPDGGTHVTTTYEYDPKTAELLATRYHDGGVTSDVTTTYNRLGQPVTITDGTGARTFLWDGESPWRLNGELLPDFYQNRLLSRLYETGTDASWGSVKGRSRGFQLGTPMNPGADLEQTFRCNALGRIASLTSARTGGAGMQTFAYAYVANSRLLESLAATGTAFTLTRSYEAHRDLLTDITGKWSTFTRSHYAYQSNDLGQRQKSTQDGDAYADATDNGESTHQDYAYNDRGELRSAHAYLGSGQDRALPGRQYDFNYDAIGNRTSVNHTGDPSKAETVEFNTLNQIERRENKSVSVSGTAAADAAVTVGGAPAARQGRFWQRELALANSTGPVVEEVDTVAAKPGAGAGGTDIAQFDRRYIFMSRANEAPTYDADGNLTGDDHWTYAWDSENRLVSMEANAWVSTLGARRQRLEFAYDYMGRRVEKRVLNAAPSPGTWTLASKTRYLYDGWNLIAEFALNSQPSTLNSQPSTFNLARSYTWGLDLVGSLTASGGVGALVQITEHATGQRYLPTYDGNGNVTALVRASDGGVSASYEYSPFGEVLRASGSYAKTNAFRFSTKFTDNETGLVYYGHRYYDAKNGRFINRDSIEEAGGINLYGFCGNDGINHTDYLGNFNLFKSIGNFFKKYWKIIVVAVLSVVTAGLAAIAMGALLVGTSFAVVGTTTLTTAGAMIAGAVGGAVGGFVGGVAGVALNGGSFGQAMTAGAWGALGGAVAGAVGGYFGKVSGAGNFAWAQEATRALTHGITQAGVAVLHGGKFGASFASGFFSSFAGSGLQFANAPGYVGIPVGSVIGGLSSKISGGSFDEGFAQGFAVNAYNLWEHDIAKWAKQQWNRVTSFFNDFEIKATPPGIYFGIRKVNIAIENELSNPEERGMFSRDLAGNPVFTSGAVYDDKFAIKIGYGHGEIDIIDYSSKYYRGYGDAYGGSAHTERWGGKFSFFNEGEIEVEGGQAIKFKSGESPKVKIISYRLPVLGGVELLYGKH